MERYQMPEQEKAIIEKLRFPFAVYQFIDKRVVTLALSDGFCEKFGFSDHKEAAYVMDHDMYRDTHPEDVTRVAEEGIRFATEGGVYDVIYRTKSADKKDYIVLHAHGEHVITEKGGVRLAHVWYMDEGTCDEKDLTQETMMEHVLANALREENTVRISRFDHLTGLPNLTYFLEMVEAGKSSMLSEGYKPAMLYMDLNGMKYYNHRKGFAEGDRMLQTFAGLLKHTFGSDNCCHIGADRFAVCTKEEGLEKVLHSFFSEAEKINGKDSLPVRVGVYPSSIEDVTAGKAYDRAKVACDAIPGTDTSACNFYDKELSEYETKRRYIKANIDRAIAEDWIKVYYQPIVRAVNGKVCDEEALARWIDPEKGFLSPADFIPHLEETGLIYKLDLFVLEQTLLKMKDMKERGLPVVPHSINLSRSDFDACDIVEEIRKRVDSSGFGRDMISIEITESIIGGEFEFMKKKIERFRELGFTVWMDDFGSGYSSLNVLQSIPFDLIKFDMSFMRRLDEGESGKIILTELMKMATSLGVETVCEGVETESQVRFLQEAGCSKLQGFYFNKPRPYEEILEIVGDKNRIGFEDSRTSSYYESIGRVNLYDLGMVASDETDSFQNAYNTLPMGIIEIQGDMARFIRSNQSYREFIKKFFEEEITAAKPEFKKYDAPFIKNIIKTCCEQGMKALYYERMPDGSMVHSFARRIDTNPVDGSTAVAVAVLSISDPTEDESYADIARALATDYNNIFVVDLDSGKYTEYISSVGADELSKRRNGTDFFGSVSKEAAQRVYKEDQQLFLNRCTKENILRELDRQGAFTTTYRLMDTGTPVYNNMKITRLQRGNRIIIGISTVDAQMKLREQLQKAREERASLAKIMAISEDYLSLYAIHTDTGRYIEYTSSDEYEAFGFAKEGEDFFLQGVLDGKKVVCPEDLPKYLEGFTRENVLREIQENGAFKLHYRLMLDRGPHPVTLKIVAFNEGREEQLLASVRAWQIRK